MHVQLVKGEPSGTTETKRESRSPKKESFVPSCDHWESASGHVYCFDLPGVRREAIEVRIEDGKLSLTGHRTCIGHGTCRGPLECPHGHFERRLDLPDGLDLGATTARYHDGILKIEVPRKTPPATILVPVEQIWPLPAGWPKEVEEEDDMDLDPCLD